MDRLPIEVLLSIYSLLTQIDLLRCITVCRLWHDVIQRHCLFRNINIYDQEKLKQLVQKVQRDPTLGTKVERLLLQFDIEGSFNAENLVVCFPNLHHFFISCTNDYKGVGEHAQPRQGHPWCERIEGIVEEMTDLNTRTLLVSGICKNLTAVSTNANENVGGSSFIRSLANTPTLKMLALRGYTFSCIDFEILHQLAPFLDSLLIKNSKFLRCELPVKIKPATLIKKFKFTVLNFREVDDYNFHLHYFSKKYTHLETLILEVEAFGRDNVNLIESKKRTKTILTSYLKTLGQRLKTLSLKINNKDRTFSDDFYLHSLGECGIQVSNFELSMHFDSISLEQLAKTTQVQYIQSLTLNQMATGGDGLIAWEWLRYFKKLKELTLRFPYRKDGKGRHPLNMTDLLDKLGEARLKTLRIHNVNLQVNNSSKNDIYPSLDNLVLWYSSIQLGVDAFISKSLPNLKHLTIKLCFKKRVLFMLQNIDLSSLDVGYMSSICEFPILVTTLANNQRRLYNLTSSKPFGETDSIPTVTIVCNSLYTFHFMSNS